MQNLDVEKVKQKMAPRRTTIGISSKMKCVVPWSVLHLSNQD